MRIDSAGHLFRLICSKTRVTSSINRSSGGSWSTERGRIPTSPGVARFARLRRIASRKRRLIRLRRVAAPIDFPTKTPYLNCSAGCQMRVKKSVGKRCPVSKSESISTRRLRLTERGNLLFPTNCRGQPFPAFGPTAREHLATVLGRHAGTEAVIVQFLTVRWLKRSFHFPPISKLALEYSTNRPPVKALISKSNTAIVSLKSG